MNKNRLEAFSDGVIAIIITIMVLEMKVPHGADLSALTALWPVFLSYVLSFLYVGIYWNNHHHLLQAARNVDGRVLWANLHLLFWLSLMPFTTGWMGENHFAALPTTLYGANLLACGWAYMGLQKCLANFHGPDSHLATALSHERKERLSLAGYGLGMALAWWLHPMAGLVTFLSVPALWLVPDRRMAAVVAARGAGEQ
jgi:uncharacterized membrane protein